MWKFIIPSLLFVVVLLMCASPATSSEAAMDKNTTDEGKVVSLDSLPADVKSAIEKAGKKYPLYRIGEIRAVKRSKMLYKVEWIWNSAIDGGVHEQPPVWFGVTVPKDTK
jgi:hypothetical protein